MMATTGHAGGALSAGAGGPADAQPLSHHVRHAIERYFVELNGQDPNELYELVLREVEQPLLEVVMAHTRGNVSKAAELLGMNRATLRKKIHKYGIGH